jgi:hypothetical protein
MECKRIEQLLSSYAEDELEPEEKRAVEAHLKTCSSCAETLSFVRETTTSLSSFPALEVSQSLLSRLYALPEKKKRLQTVMDLFLRPSLQPVFAAATVLLIMISFYLFHPNRSQINRAIERQIHLGYSKVEKLYVEAESISHSLGEYKENLLVTIKNFKLFSGDEEQTSKT